jgi:hypothetical protein
MSLPTPRPPRHGGGRWDAIICALDSWPRTFRLCLIILVATMVSSGMAAVVAELIRRLVLAGPGGLQRRRPGEYAQCPFCGRLQPADSGACHHRAISAQFRPRWRLCDLLLCRSQRVREARPFRTSVEHGQSGTAARASGSSPSPLPRRRVPSPCWRAGPRGRQGSAGRSPPQASRYASARSAASGRPRSATALMTSRARQ